uniref:Uncharacterized protein n=1 Tax=Candidatus Kentrum sp. DK TaxID=2126562 RepID=A0A450SH33_9GAMM|nr:MAG: hypothetical protein BECKDK2373C_GA0170839_103611 [Candidatus Kentron sp. DK]
MDIEKLINAIRHSRVKITDHADEEATNDSLIFDEICFSVQHGKVIEDYPNDKPLSKLPDYGEELCG